MKGLSYSISGTPGDIAAFTCFECKYRLGLSMISRLCGNDVAVRFAVKLSQRFTQELRFIR